MKAHEEIIAVEILEINMLGLPIAVNLHNLTFNYVEHSRLVPTAIRREGSEYVPTPDCTAKRFVANLN